MGTFRIIILFSCVVLFQSVVAQNPEFKGQASGWTNWNPSNELQLWGGARYLPQLNAQVGEQSKGLFDFEVSANLSGTMGTLPFDSLYTSGSIKPYRFWARYSTEQLEIRA